MMNCFPFPIIRCRVLSPLYRSGTERQKSELREYRVFLFDGIAFENRFRLFITNAGFTSFRKPRIVSRYRFTLVDSMTRRDIGALCFQSNCVWASLKVTALFLEAKLLLCSSDKGEKTARWCFPVKITTADESVREPAREAVGGKCIVRFYMSTRLGWFMTVSVNGIFCKNCSRLCPQPLRQDLHRLLVVKCQDLEFSNYFSLWLLLTRLTLDFKSLTLSHLILSRVCGLPQKKEIAPPGVSKIFVGTCKPWF